jgi:translation initiation factor 3 subunit E
MLIDMLLLRIVRLFSQVVLFQFECGLYAEAAEMLAHYLMLNHPTNSPKVVAATWGHLAALLLQGNYSDALRHVNGLKDIIEMRNASPLENRSINPLDQLVQRAWLMHWSLFVFFNQPAGQDQLIDFFTEKHNMQTMENKAPWLLRYEIA